MAYLYTPALIPALSVGGILISGAKLYAYLAGTSTETPTFTDEDGDTENEWPVVADSAGRFPPIFLDENTGYRIKVTNATGSDTLYDRSPIEPPVPSTVALYSELAGNGGAALIGAADGFTVQEELDGLEGILTPKMFGAVGDGVTDDTTALNAFFAHCAATQVEAALAGGNYAVSSGIFVGGAVTTATLQYFGRMHITALAAIAQVVTIRGSINLQWNGAIEISGTGSTSFSSRTCEVGVYQAGAGRLTISGGIVATNLAYAAFTAIKGNTNTSLSSLGHIRSYMCGSVPTLATAYSTANWSSHSQTGSAGVLGQRDILTVDTMPPTFVDTYITAGNGPLFAEIDSQLYQIMALDRGANTISLSHWLPSTAVAGVVKYIFGGGVILPAGTDHNVYGISRLDATYCGIGLANSCFYGAETSRLVTQICGIGLVLGVHPVTSMLGGKTSGYFEANDFDIVATGTTVATHWHYIDSEWALNLAKCVTIGARKADDALSETYTGFIRVPMMYQGHLLRYEKRANNADASASAVEVPIQWQQPAFVLQTNGLTIRPRVSADINRLYGTDSREVILVGTGPNRGPTGSPVFANSVMPSGWTINGGSTATFTGPFYGPAHFLMRADFVAQDLKVTLISRGTAKRGVTAVGNVDVTLTPGTSKETQRFATTLTADRAVTLDTTAAVEGDRFRIVRPAAGAFNLNVGSGPLKALAASTWCEVEYTGSAWVLTAYGAL